MRVTLIYNPVAGGGRDRLLRRFEQALRDEGAVVTTYRTRYPGDATRYLQELEDQGDVVVAVGGDGTTNEVINGLAVGVRLGVFATGTANVLANELRLPAHPRRAAVIVVRGVDMPVYTGRVNQRRFVMMVGVGFDAWVVRSVDLTLKKRIGKGAYLYAMLKALSDYGKQRYRLMIDGEAHECYSAIVTKGRRYGGSFVLSRRADMTAPSFQVLMLQNPSVGSLLLAMLALPLGLMESMPGVVSLPASSLEVTLPGESEALQCDGDRMGCLPARIEVDPQRIVLRVSSRAASAYAAR